MKYIGIDPSTKTGLVVLDEDGTVLVEKEITSKVKEDPQRFMDISEQVIKSVGINELICIEGFSYDSRGRGVSTQYGIGWIIRSDLLRSGSQYIEVSPGGLKKFASGKGNTKKDELAVHIYKKWGFESKSDDIRDAYVLARMAMALDDKLDLTAYQKETLKKVNQ